MGRQSCSIAYPQRSAAPLVVLPKWNAQITSMRAGRTVVSFVFDMGAPQ